MKNYDIAIIGYGPVGAITANLFAQKGFDIVVVEPKKDIWNIPRACLLYTSPSPRDLSTSRMPSSA